MGNNLISESRFSKGCWTGIMNSSGAKSVSPEVGVFLDGQDLGDASSSAEDDGRWLLKFPIPPEVLGEGVSTFLFVERKTSETLGRFCVIAGEMAELDVLAQLDALQSELDQLKSAFRHEARRSRIDH